VISVEKSKIGEDMKKVRCYVTVNSYEIVCVYLAAYVVHTCFRVYIDLHVDVFRLICFQDF